MRIAIITPAVAGSRHGNRVTALRWARLLRRLGHRVHVRQHYRGEPDDLLIALHARRSFLAIQSWRQANPHKGLVVALTGTDLYGDIHDDAKARESLELASCLVLLQPLGLNQLPERLRSKARVIYQSAQAPRLRRPRDKAHFDICVLGHLRPVKDPFRTARASRLLPTSSRQRVLHLGAALSRDMQTRVRREMAANSRYRWLGDVPRSRALQVLGSCRLLVHTSLLEGGANAVTEAIAAGVPVLSSRIAGSIGILGPDYGGYFPVCDTQALAALLHRAETDHRFYQSLKTQCRRLRPLVDPARELASWQQLLRQISARGR
jgi:putative glycosyltransferase (TIGR04348 family)